MPAPTASSRHLYTGHRRGSTQAAPRLRARHPGVPLSWELWSSPVLMPSFRLSMRQQWFTHVRLLAAHLTRWQRAFSATLTTPALNRRSLRWFGLPTCIGEPGGPNLHHRHSTVRNGDLLHRHHFPFRTHPITAGRRALSLTIPVTCSSAVPRLRGLGAVWLVWGGRCRRTRPGLDGTRGVIATSKRHGHHGRRAPAAVPPRLPVRAQRWGAARFGCAARFRLRRPCSRASRPHGHGACCRRCPGQVQQLRRRPAGPASGGGQGSRVGRIFWRR